jgi:outer membrane protein assembly factor BamA
MSGKKRGPAWRVRSSHVILLSVLWLMGPVTLSHAAEDVPAADLEEPPAFRVPTPPEFMRKKPRIPELELKNKKEGWYFTGIPLIGVDPDSGFNYGASIQLYDDGPKNSPFFYYAPYRKRIEVSVLRTTGGTQEYTVAYDQPYIADSPWRLRAFGGYLGNKFQDYFGVGERTLERLGFPGNPGTTYRRASEYFDAIKANPDGETWARFNFYDKRQILFTTDLERDYLGGLLRPLVGIQVSHLEAVDYTGVEVKGAINQETLLHQDYREGRIRGFDGGWLNYLRLGLTYDSRDYEPDPSSGVLGQVLFEGTTRWVGANSDYGHVTLGWQGYHRLFPGLTQLVLAANAVYSAHFGVVPFYAFPSMSVPTDERKQGLGGFESLRGYHANRFVGKVQMQGNLELRWSLPDFTIWKQNLRPMIVPFVDVGRVFDKIARFSVSDWKATGGLSVRLAWNLATIISFDYGFGSEGNLFYMELGHPF